MARPTEKTLKTLNVGDTVRVTVGTNAKAREYTVNAVSENGAGLTGAKGAWRNLVPTTCGRALHLTGLHSRDLVSKLEVA